MTLKPNSPARTRTNRDKQKLILLLGGQQETGNLGVSALGTSCVGWLREAIGNVDVLIQGSYRDVKLEFPGKSVLLPTTNLHVSSKLGERHGTRHLRLMNSLPRTMQNALMSWRGNRVHEQLRDVDLILDLSGGDSMAEIYPQSQFDAQCVIKEYALSIRKPLVLMPQTIGPLLTEKGRARVRKIVSRCAIVATRELNGLRELEELQQDTTDNRFHSCPDMAFGLEPVNVERESVPFLRTVKGPDVLVGLNVSELLYDRTDSFGMSVDYREATHAIVEWAMQQDRTKVLLVPHVVDSSRHVNVIPPNDRDSCRKVLERFRNRFAGRIGICEGSYGPGQIKSIIGNCDFFIGARMHACIGALSQGIATATLAYSKKACGVLGRVRMEDSVIDLRSQKNVDDVVAAIDKQFRRRELSSLELSECAAQAKSEIRAFFRDTLVPLIEEI